MIDKVLVEGYSYYTYLNDLIRSNEDIVCFDGPNNESFYHVGGRKKNRFDGLLGKILTVTTNPININQLALAIRRRLRRKNGETNKHYLPPLSAVRGFINAYPRLHVDGEYVTILVEKQALTLGEVDVVRFLKKNKYASKNDLAEYLKEQNHSGSYANIIDIIYHSPIITTSGGQKHYRFSLIGSDSVDGEDFFDLDDEVIEILTEAEPEIAIDDLVFQSFDESESGYRTGRKISRKEFDDALAKAQKNGDDGEMFVCSYLEQCKSYGYISRYEWVSIDNPIAPYDFVIYDLDDNQVFIDAKSTSGDFDLIIHISYSELSKMSQSEQYYLYRVYELTDTGAKLSISENMNSFAKTILEVLRQLPYGVRSDGISLRPSQIVFKNIF